MIKFKALVRAAVIVVLYFLCGCLGKGTSGGRLYFEPPERLIDDYTGMVEVMELNWAWAQPGFKLDNYQSLSLNPVINLTGVKDNGIARRVDEKLAAWFAENGFSLSESGFERTGINGEEQIAALDLIALFEMNPDEFTTNPRSDHHRRIRLHIPYRLHLNGNPPGHGRGDRHRN